MQKQLLVPLWAAIAIPSLLLAQSFALITGRAEPTEAQQQTQASELTADGTPSPVMRQGAFVLREEFVQAKGGKTYTLSHRCDGSEMPAEPVSGGGFAYDTWCSGENSLVVVSPDGTETPVATETANSPTTAVSLSEVSYVRGSSTILFSFQHHDCEFEGESCGVGSAHNTVNYAFETIDLGTSNTRVRPIENFPPFGDPIWNDAGTKAIFPVAQVGGAGCDGGPIVWYNLAMDMEGSLTADIACPFETNGLARDVSGDPMPEWGLLKWTDNDSFTTVIHEVDGTWKAVNGTFK